MMDDAKEIRMRCLQLAVTCMQGQQTVHSIATVAKQFADYVESGTVPDAPAPTEQPVQRPVGAELQ